MTEDEAIADQIKTFEQRLLEPQIRKSASAVGELLADDFREYAGSGQVYDKAQIIEALRSSPSAAASLTDFKAVILAPDVALATFRYSRGATPDRPAAQSLRSSVWKRLNGRWQMVFHQGTLCAPE